MQRRAAWDEAAQRLIDAARAVERAGADFVVICTNTMHKLADDVAAAVSIPLLHIADATAERIKAAGVRKVGLLGTRFTMEEDSTQGGCGVCTGWRLSCRRSRSGSWCMT